MVDPARAGLASPGIGHNSRGLVFGSVCSGIEAASVAWHPLGWRAAFVSEIEAFPRAVLQMRWPDTPLHGDFTTIQAGQYEPIDLLVGGTPCQSFSVAGLRGGLADDRGNLALEFLRLAQRLRPRWVVWENVPGVLSSNGGRDFGAILGGLGELGYGFAYRVLDAQFFGVAQRRRRVFVVGRLGDWRRAAAVLFERASLSGNPAPRRTAGKVPAALTASGVGTCGADDNQGQAGHLISSTPISHCLNAGAMGRQDYETETLIAHTLKGEGFDGSEDGTGRGTPLVPVHAFDARQSDVIQYGDLTGPLDTDGSSVGVLTPAPQFSCDACGEAFADPHAAGVGGLAPAECPRCGEEERVSVFSIMPQNSGRDYKARPVDVAQPIMAGGPGLGAQGGDVVLAFTGKDSGQDVGDTAPTLRAMGSRRGRPNGGGQVAVAIPINADALRGEGAAATPSRDAAGKVRLRDPGFGVGADGDPAGTLNAAGPGAVAYAISAGGDAGPTLADIEAGLSAIERADARRRLVEGAVAIQERAVCENPAAGPGGAGYRTDGTAYTLEARSTPQAVAFAVRGRDGGSVPEVHDAGDSVGALRAAAGGSTRDHIAFDSQQITHPANRTRAEPGLPSSTVARASRLHMASASMATVRRLTPTECERLQGFDDHYTLIPWKGAWAPDGPRYKALGNSMAVPVMRWIGERIAAVEAITDGLGECPR